MKGNHLSWLEHMREERRVINMNGEGCRGRGLTEMD
jgi:hypothetical protein